MSPLFRQSVGGRTLDPQALDEFQLWFYLRNEKRAFERVSSMTGWRDKRARESGYGQKFLELLAKSSRLVGVVRCPHCDRSVQARDLLWHFCPPFAEEINAWSVFDRIDYERSLGKADLRLVEELQKMLKDSLEKEAYRLWREESGMWSFFYEEGLTEEDCFERYHIYKWAGFLSLLRPVEFEWPPDSAELKRVKRFWNQYFRRGNDSKKKVLFRLFNRKRSVEEVFKQARQGLSLKDYGIIRDTCGLGHKEAAQKWEELGFKGFGRRSPVAVYKNSASVFRALRSRWNREAQEFSGRESGPL